MGSLTTSPRPPPSRYLHGMLLHAKRRGWGRPFKAQLRGLDVGSELQDLLHRWHGQPVDELLRGLRLRGQGVVELRQLRNVRGLGRYAVAAELHRSQRTLSRRPGRLHLDTLFISYAVFSFQKNTSRQ